MEGSPIVLTIPTDHEIYRRISRLERQLNTMTDATQATIDALTEKVEGISTDVQTVQTNLQAEINSLAAANPALDLSGLETALEPLDGHVKALGELKPEGASPAPTPDPSPTPEPSPEPEPVSADTKPLYTYGGPLPVTDSAWTIASVLTIEGAALYEYGPDVAGGAATGDGLGGVWHEYTGATEPVPTT